MRKLNELLINGSIKIKEADGKKIVDLNELGYKTTRWRYSKRSVTIKVGKATERAIQKVKQMGGEVILSPTE
ncbi:uL15m family ribosomal protein [Sulfolobus sp. E11-6]|uniref:uL15m family ribosomal protein n=1 Tax=Sulfolobus sp. E11-6 TaxID=2663020 RepID=UPI0039C9F3F4